MVARPTKDVDLLSSSESGSESMLRAILLAVSSTEIDDGLEFDGSSIAVAPIAAQTEHGGVRGTVLARLGTARTRLQVDMGFGDIITGGPVRRSYRTILGNRSFSIQMYSDETVAAEKIEALASLGVINSRYKDLLDLFELLVVAELPERRVVEATINTFMNRKTSVSSHPEVLSDYHWLSEQFSKGWKNFLRRIEMTSPDLVELRSDLLPRLRRIYEAVRIQLAQRTGD
jgi:hypothetical protein